MRDSYRDIKSDELVSNLSYLNETESKLKEEGISVNDIIDKVYTE